MNETEVLRCIREELIGVEEFMDKLFSQKMNRMKESMYKFKELELSDEQIADLLGLVYKGHETEIEDMLATYDYRLHLLDQLDKSYKIIQEKTESLINLIQQSHNLVHNGVYDEKDN